MIRGDRVALRPMTKEDMPLMVAWRNHPDSKKWFFSQLDLTLEDQIQWYEKTRNDPGERFFIIESDESEPLGTVSIYNIDPVRRSADYGRMLIAPDQRGRRRFPRFLRTAGSAAVHQLGKARREGHSQQSYDSAARREFG